MDTQEINHQFVYNQIRKYNRARRLSYQDAALVAVGVHAGLLQKSRVALRELTNEERQKVLYFLKQFCLENGPENVTFQQTLVR